MAATDASPPKKESSVLTEASLSAFVKEFEANAMVVAMYLNIPTTTLVNFHLPVHANECSEGEAFLEVMKYWKQMRASAKEREKVADLDRALRELGKADHADVITERHKENMELTADCFPSK
ncbi:hypothetical protein CAPTEDRAFT_19108 [Capitella teleta]|uniref:Death domain-containing protein n=1 Tax=Capitella teleta TaxID=283909 RepID=R7UJS6_CAPTE|nr:hypothetical protein CAPTEDRAFT_19108 [Capitella teleta]|eukprot:ELU04033.1 hypothetical protein CAPTEDRAFT_19108 [Capitella teleta]